MPVAQIGQANHMYLDGSVDTLKISTVDAGRTGKFITISNEYEESIIISSRSQWSQVDAFVRRALDDIEDE